ncbi:aldo/keto reductase [Pseudomonas aeruginosa]
MTTRKLGNSGLEIPALVFGGNVFGWTADESTSFKAAGRPARRRPELHRHRRRIFALGSRAPGRRVETLIGKWLKRTGKRDRMVIASKVGMDMGNGQRPLRRLYRAGPGALATTPADRLPGPLPVAHRRSPQRPGGNPFHLWRTDQERQGTGHRRLQPTTPGASSKRARSAPGLTCRATRACNPEYNLYDRADYETNLEPTVEELGIGVISYYSLASGFLQRQVPQPGRHRRASPGEKVKGYLNERGVAILAALDEVAEQYNANPTQVALAWLIARPTGDRADRQRHQPGTARRPDRRHPPEARRTGDPPPGQRQRLLTDLPSRAASPR